MSEIFNYTILNNPYIPHKPTPKQAEFLLLNCREALYGGAAGGGKSDALLMGALQYVMVPNYSAIIFRRTYNDLALPGALMDRALEWLSPTSAHWNSLKHIWSFPSGANLTFGNLEHENTKYRYQSAEFQYIAFDELTQFTETQYRYLFSRLRRLENYPIPLRMRSASNPGNIGHDWVKRRFIVAHEESDRIFIPAKLTENPHLDQTTYIQSLNQLDPITRRQLLNGDWTARHGGSIFKREWFSIIREKPVNYKYVRYWDRAATKPAPNKEPSYTVGVLMGYYNGQYVVADVKRFRADPATNERIIKQTAIIDNTNSHVPIYMEQEPGSSGVDTISHYSRNILTGFEFRGIKTTGSKEERAGPFSSATEAGNVKLVQGAWNGSYLDELEAFPEGSHDDQVDASSGAFSQLVKPKGFFL